MIVDKIIERYAISKASASLYLRNFTKIETKLTEDEMKDPEKLGEYLKDLKDNTKRTYIMAVIRVLSSQDKLTKEETEVLDKYYEEITKTVETERESTTRKAPKVNFDKILSSLNVQINGATTRKRVSELLQDKLLVLINSDIPVRRAMDWYDMEIVADSTEEISSNPEFTENYYNLKAFIFKKYKTMKTYGVQVVKPTTRIKRTIRMMLDARGEDPGEYLFITTQGKKMSNPTFNKNLKRVMGVATNELRKIYENTHCNTPEVKKAIEIAKEMGHSLDTAVNSYYDQG